MWVTRWQIKWNEAELACQRKEGHLASVTSKKVFDHMLYRAGNNRVWIGGKDKWRNGTWTWIDGSPFDFTGGWASGKPSLDSREFCVELYNADATDHGWNDVDCDSSRSYVCTRAICSGTCTLIPLIDLIFVQQRSRHNKLLLRASIRRTSD